MRQSARVAIVSGTVNYSVRGNIVLILDRLLVDAQLLMMSAPAAAPPPTFPNPPPKAPPGALGNTANSFLGILKWILIVAAVGALIWTGVQMVAGRRRRNEMAVDAVMSIPWIVGGLILGLGAAGILLFFLGY